MYDHIKEKRPIPSMDAFPGILGRICKELDPWTDADPIAMMATAIAKVSVLLEGKCKVYMGGKWRTPQVNMLAFGPSATGAKGTSNVYTSMVFDRAFPDWGKYHIMVSAPSSGSGLVKRIANMAMDADHMISIDEALAEGIIDYDGKGNLIDKPLNRLKPSFPTMVYEEELAKVLQRAKMDDQYEPLIRTMWQGGEATAKYGTNSTVRLIAPIVSWLCHITPGEFLARLGRASLSGGTFNRFAILYVKRTRELDWEEPVPDDILNNLSRDLLKRVQWATGAAWAHQKEPKPGQEDTRYRMGYSPAYKAYWKKEVHPPLNAMLKGDDPMLSDFAGRARDYVKLLAGIFAIMDYRIVMEPKDLKAALAFMQYCLDSLPMIMKALGDNSPVAGKQATINGDARQAKPGAIKAVREYLVANGSTPKGKLTKMFQGTWTGPEIDNAIVWHNGDVEAAYQKGNVANRPIILLTWIGPTDPPDEAEEPSEPLPVRMAPEPRVKAPRARREAVRPVQSPVQATSLTDVEDVLADW